MCNILANVVCKCALRTHQNPIIKILKKIFMGITQQSGRGYGFSLQMNFSRYNPDETHRRVADTKALAIELTSADFTLPNEHFSNDFRFFQ